MKKLLTLTVLMSAFAVTSALAADGKALYEAKCNKCHGPDGKGQTTMGKRNNCKDYSDPKVQEALKDDAFIKAVKQGVKNKEGTEVMKPTEGVTDEEAKALLTYFRTLKK